MPPRVGDPFGNPPAITGPDPAEPAGLESVRSERRRRGAPYPSGRDVLARAEADQDREPGVFVEELLRRAKTHPPYGEDVIDDLTAEEAEAFLAAVRS